MPSYTVTTNLILFAMIPREQTLVVFTAFADTSPSVGHLIEIFSDRSEEQDLLESERKYEECEPGM